MGSWDSAAHHCTSGRIPFLSDASVGIPVFSTCFPTTGQATPSPTLPSDRPCAPCAPQVFYNNLFSLPLVLVLMMAEGEVGQVLHEPDLYNRRFQLALLVSGLLSFGLG